MKFRKSYTPGLSAVTSEHNGTCTKYDINNICELTENSIKITDVEGNPEDLKEILSFEITT